MQGTRKVRIITALLAVMLLSSALFITAAAADPFAPSINFLPEDADDVNSLYLKLGDLKSQYFLYGNEVPAGKSASIAITKYQDALAAQSLTNDEAKLVYYKGVVAADLAFIYHKYIGTQGTPIAPFDDPATAEKLAAVYTALTAELDANSYANWQELRTSATGKKQDNGILSRLLAAIYEARIAALVTAEDSDAARAFATDAVTRVNNVPADKLPYEEAEYERIFAETATSVDIQKKQDRAMAELRSAFALLVPNGEVDSYPAVKNALAAIDLDTGESDTEEQMNEHMRVALLEVLGSLDSGKKYNSAYISGEKLALAELITAADAEGALAPVASLFTDHALELDRANKKDAIAADIESHSYKNDQRMKELEAEYNAAGGTLDACTTHEALALEVEKAALRADLYGDMLAAKQGIADYLETTPLTAEADAKYAAADEAIKTAEDKSAAEKSYSDGKSELEHLVVRAEADRFKLDNKAILEKAVADIKPEDKPALAEAMKDAKALSAAAIAELKKEKAFDGIADRYREATKKAIDAALGEGTPLRAEHNTALDAALDALALGDDPANFDKFVKDADTALARAEAADRVCDRYDAITAAEHYAALAEADKTALLEIADGAADKLVTAAPETLTAEADAAVTALNRREAEARIDAAAKIRTDIDAEAKAEIEATVKAAKETIAAISDPTLISSTADTAIFDIEKSCIINDIRGELAAAKTEIGKLPFLPAQKKTAAEAELDRIYQNAVTEIHAAKTDEGVSAAGRTASSDITHTVGLAKADDMIAANAMLNGLRGDADTKAGALKSAINAQPYLSDDEKELLAHEVDAALDGFKKAIDSAATPEAAEGLFSELEGKLADISTSATAQNTSAAETKKTDSKTEIRGVYNELESKLEELKYLTGTQKQSILSRAQTVMQTFDTELSEAKNLDLLIAAGSKAADRLDALYDEAYDQNLAAAKDAARSALDLMQRDLNKTIDKLIYLSAEQKTDARSELYETLGGYSAEIERADTPESVETTRERAAHSTSTQKEKLTKADLEACTAIFTPIITVLACVFGAELIIIALLVLISKRRSLMAVWAMPLAAKQAVTLSPTAAWIVAIVLAVLDLIGLGLIIYLTVRLIRDVARALAERRPPKPEEDEDEIEAEPEPEPEPEPELEPEPEEAELAVEEYEPEQEPEEEIEEIEEIEEELVIEELVPEPEPEPEQIEEPIAITVEEAERLMTDEEAIELETEQTRGFVDDEVYHGKKKTEINIDVIGRNFESGDKVTLNSLKEKRLVARDAGAVKVLGRGSLDKPLTVVAQSFSTSAVKMILLTGGEAIVTYPSVERQK